MIALFSFNELSVVAAVPEIGSTTVLALIIETGKNNCYYGRSID